MLQTNYAQTARAHADVDSTAHSNDTTRGRPAKPRGVNTNYEYTNTIRYRDSILSSFDVWVVILHAPASAGEKITGGGGRCTVQGGAES